MLQVYDENNKIENKNIKGIPKVFATKASLECWRVCWDIFPSEGLERLTPHSAMDSRLDIRLFGLSERALS